VNTDDEAPICDDQLMAFDEGAHDNRCSINMYWYKRIRERLRLAEIGALDSSELGSKLGVCQVCKLTYDPATKYETTGVHYGMSPHRFRCCGYDCLTTSWRLNGAYELRRTMKLLPTMSFETFQDLFAFGEEGGYAANLWEQARTQPLAFMYRLDDDNYAKLALRRG